MELVSPNIISHLNSFIRFTEYYFTISAVVVGLRMIPFVFRRTSFFKNVEIQCRYFHRSTCIPDLLSIKQNLLAELREEDNGLPRDGNDKLVILELNAGGGNLIILRNF